jgi:hypothetical protein
MGVSEESPLITSKLQNIEELKKFRTYLDNNHKRNLTKISLNFQHGRFQDNTGFAILQMTGKFSMSGLKRALYKVIEEEIESLEDAIRELRS